MLLTSVENIKARTGCALAESEKTVEFLIEAASDRFLKETCLDYGYEQGHEEIIIYSGGSIFLSKTPVEQVTSLSYIKDCGTECTVEFELIDSDCGMLSPCCDPVDFPMRGYKKGLSDPFSLKTVYKAVYDGGIRTYDQLEEGSPSGVPSMVRELIERQVIFMLSDQDRGALRRKKVGPTELEYFAPGSEATGGLVAGWDEVVGLFTSDTSLLGAV